MHLHVIKQKAGAQMYIESENFLEVTKKDEFVHASGVLPFILGKDEAGQIVIKDLDEVQHLLIAGATGAGKSNLVHSILLSLMTKVSPDKCSFIFCDTKIIEFSDYQKSRYSLIEPATDTTKISACLQWGVAEMMRRLKAFSEDQCRSLSAYNDKAWEGFGDLSHIVIVIDDVAFVAESSETRELIHRLLQAGHRAGIHLIMVTQTPHTNALSQIIKYLTPTRAVFNIFSSNDEKLLLDSSKNQSVTDVGEMIFYELVPHKKQKIRCYQVYDNDLTTITSAFLDLSASRKEFLFNDFPKPEKETDTDHLHADKMLPASVDIILETGQASVSTLQRRLKLGYARASKIIDQMEEIGFIGPFQGSIPRTILITRDEWTAHPLNPSSSVIAEPEDLEIEKNVDEPFSNVVETPMVKEVISKSENNTPHLPDAVPKKQSLIVWVLKKHIIFYGVFIAYHIVFSNFFPVDEATNTLIAPDWYVWVGLTLAFIITFGKDIYKRCKAVFAVPLSSQNQGTKSMFQSLTSNIKSTVKGMHTTNMDVNNYVVVDIETTGLDKHKNRIIEIAAIRYSKGIELERYHTMVDPEVTLSHKIIKLTGITQEDLYDAPTINNVKTDFLKFIGSSTLIGHNAVRFDIPFLSAQLHTDIQNNVIDTLELSQACFPNLPSYRLNDLKDRLNLHDGRSHRAMDDVITTNALFLRCLNKR